MNKIPVWAIVLAAIIAISILGFFIMKFVKSQDTQGVEYGGGPEQYKKRMMEQNKKVSGGGVSSGYGANRPAQPASAAGRGGYGGASRPGGGGYGGR